MPEDGSTRPVLFLEGGDGFDQSNQGHEVPGGRLELREGVSSKILSRRDLDVQDLTFASF